MLTKDLIISQGWNYTNTNGIRHWFNRPNPGRIHPNYGHHFHPLTMIVDFSDGSVTIENHEEMLFTGIIFSPKDFINVMKITNINQTYQDEIHLLGEHHILGCGWESWYEENYTTDEGNYVTAYLFHSGSDTYMLTNSVEYVKIIVKGSSKDKNKELFRGKIGGRKVLTETMEKLNICTTK